MTTAYPGAIDALARPSDTTYTDDSGYELDVVIDNISDAIEAVETKVGTASSTAARNKALIGSGTGASKWDTVGRKNLLINGDFRVWQRGTSPSVADNGYGADRWRLLLEAASAAAMAQDTSDVPTDGGNSVCKLTVGSGEDNKFGIWQVLEGQDVKHLRGKKVSLQAKLKVTSAITDVRMAVVEWTSTEDGVSGDPISTWGSAGSNPTLATNYAYLGTPANLSPTTSWATYRVEGLTVGASANNLAVMVWCEDETTTVTTDIMRVADVQLEEGEVCTEFGRRPLGHELLLCQRYYEKSVSLSQTPYGANQANSQVILASSIANGNTRYLNVFYKVRKRTSATVQTWDWSGTAGQASNSSGVTYGASSANVILATETDFIVGNNSSGSMTVSSNTVLMAWEAKAEL